MKNLLIYINPVDKKFSPEHLDLTRIQIDNSLSLGWKKEDIILATNFPFEYNGIKSITVDDYSVFDANRSTKIPAILQLFTENLIKDNEIYWFHDHDAFQLIPFDNTVQDLLKDKDAAFTDHGAFAKVWNAGSFFFKKSSLDIFNEMWKIMTEKVWNEQNSLSFMWTNNICNINNRYIMLDPSYNLGIYKIPENLQLSTLPVKVAHFHPHKRRHLDLYRDITPLRLMTIFNKYGIK